MPTKEEWDREAGYDCRNNPNWNDEALKKCRYKGDWFSCAICCNEEICETIMPATISSPFDTFHELLNQIDEQERRRMESYNRCLSGYWLFQKGDRLCQ